MQSTTEGWLAISTEGFAAMNAARPPEHLIKELVQNSLDSFSEAQAGRICLQVRHDGHWLHIHCSDNGSGISDLADLRVVYLTHKTDSHLKRGRFGRGFKEALCIAEQASVASGSSRLEFLRQQGQRVTRTAALTEPVQGTQVAMQMAWPPETIAQLDAYFRRFLVPEGVQLEVNGERVGPRPAEHVVHASLSTELYDPTSQSWKKPSRRTAIHLVRTRPGETATIYEMGIPVAALEWSVPFHCDIQQRVPMNPNRDAVASGYPLKLHVACLPTLLEQMDEETIKQDWVGSAGRRCDEQVQQRLIQRAFGENIARSVPRMGSRHFDEDARELGVQVINTAQTSGGFREMLKAFVPSARQVVVGDEQRKAEQAREEGFSLQEALRCGDQRQRWIEQQGGQKRVERCLQFSVWFCQRLVDTCSGRQPRVTGQLTLNPPGQSSLYAHWSTDNVLTLALDQACFWRDPLGAESLQVLIHEAAHAMAMHHGLEFRQEVERLAGEAACLMLRRAEEIRRLFPDLQHGCS
ncbi:MAG: ATP-binding protein [Synechococcaceae cyanobacterium]|nr:ATP-binding protein [Synechococcaceae cyanobacterium]